MVVLAVSSLSLVPARAAAPDVVSYQGRLLNSNGVPVADASLEFVFRFFDASVAGTCLWESDDGAACDDPDETQTVALTDGLFSENIGSAVDPAGLSEAYPADLAGVFEGATDVWLEVVVGGETLTPRKQMVAAPYALDAQALDGLDSTDFLAAAGDTGTGVFDFTGATFAGASPLAFEGATANDFETTFAFTDPTADRTITFQNGDGTVAFLSDIAAGGAQWETSAFGTYEDDDDVIIGTNGDETIDDAAFIMDGNDVFAAGIIAAEGSFVTDTSFYTNGSSFSRNDLSFVENGTISSGAGSQIYINVNGGNAAGENFLLTAANMSIGANGEIVLTPNAPVVTAITVTDTDFTNAISIADNNIVGTTAAIDFSEFDVSAATGSVTIDDVGNAGQVSVEGSVFDIDSLTFVGPASITVQGIGADLTLTASDAVIIDGGGPGMDIRDEIENTTGNVTIRDTLAPDGDGTRALGTNLLGWSSLFVRNADDGLTVSISNDGTGETNSGASVIGVFDEFGNSAGGNVQDALDDLDAAITSGGAGSMWTLSGGVVYPTAATSDFAVGGTTAAASPFGVDESANTVYIGEGAGSNGILTFKASDADTGDVIFSTNDRWEFTGGDVFVGSSALGAVKADFVPNGNDLYVAGDIAAQSNVYADTFTAGDASTVYGDGSLTTTSQNYLMNIDVSGADGLLHSIDLQIDGNTGFSVAATGDGAGGVGARTITLGVSGAADNIGIGDANADVGITDGQWNISTAGTGNFATLTVDAGSGIDTDAGGALLVAGASATSLSLCNSAACDTLLIANNGDADSITLGDSLDTTQLVASSLSIDTADWDISTTGILTGIALIEGDQNQARLVTNINVTGADVGTHEIALEVDGNYGVSVIGTGDGLGGVGGLTIGIGTEASADTVTIGDANADVSITDAQWSVSNAGAASFASLSLTSGNLNMSNNLILNIGDAGTDFVAGGGLTLAGTLTENGAAIFNSDVDITVDGTENVVIGNAIGTGSNSVDLLTINIVNTDAAANVQRGLVISNQAASTSATETLLTLDNGDAVAVTSGLSITGTGGAVTTAIDVSNANIGTAISVGDNTVIGGAAVIDFTDFDVSEDGAMILAPDNGGVAFSIAPSAPMTAGIDFANTNVGVEFQLQNDETISNQTDDFIVFNGAGGGDNTDLMINLDGTRPVLSSNTDAIIAFADNIVIDPAAGNASIDLFASDADTGSLAYTTNDTFSFTGGNLSHTGLDLLPSVLNGKSQGFDTTTTFTGTSGANLDSIQLIGGAITSVNQAAEGGGAPATVHDVFGLSAGANNTGLTAQAERLIAVLGQAQNTSGAAASIGNYVAGIEGFGLQNAVALTIPDLRGVSGRVAVNNGTVTDLFAVRGEVEAGGGGATTSYGGYFDNNNEGSTRYGVLASASGGATANYAAYFHSAAVHIETNGTPSTATLATGAGDLFVDGQLEVGGAGITAGNIAAVTTGELTTGIGLVVQRTTSGTDFTNTTSGLVDFTITDAGSSGNILYLANSGTGASLLVNADADTGNSVNEGVGGAVHIANTGNSDFGLTVYTNDDTSDNALAYFLSDNAGFDDYVVQIQSDATAAGSANGTALYILQNEIDAPNANLTGTQALIIDTNEDFGAADGLLSDAMIIVREDVGGTPDTVFRVDGDGDVWADGTLGAGAADVAEIYPSADVLVAGELVVMDPAGTGVLRSSAPYQSSLLGGVSTLPGVLLGFDDSGYKIALAGRIPLFVTDENGPIAAGDPITSSSTAGHGMKATEPGMIVGFALEDFVGPGAGSVSVFVSQQFYAGSVISTDGSVTQIEDDVELTGSLSVLGSGGADTAQMTLVTDVTDATDYRLSIENADGTQVAYVSNEGDLALAGRLYPSDRGTLQTSKYIYYDGSSGMGGDFMRTNASGWATGSYDFAEMFPSADALEPGDVVVFGITDESVARSEEASDLRLAGIVSTRPGFLAGDNVKGHYPIALAGRVPTKVSDENGSIEIGDPLTSSSRAGFAMKATEAGAIVGYALEPYDGSGDDKIIAYVNVSYWNGGETPELPGTENVASTIVVTQNADNLTALNMNGNVYLTGNDILGVRRIAGISDRWSVEEDGTVRTSGVLRTVTESYQGERVETAAVTSPDVQVTLVGTGTLVNGEAVIRFEEASPSFNDITSLDAPIRVIVTPNGPVSLYVFEKDNDGFGVRQVNGNDDGVTFDWMVSAYRKGYEPVEEEAVVEEIIEETEVVEEEVVEVIEVIEVIETDVEEPPVEEAAAESDPQSELDPEPVVTEETAPPASPEPTPDDSMESTVVEEPAP